jgi:hypothetical protein
VSRPGAVERQALDRKAEVVPAKVALVQAGGAMATNVIDGLEQMARPLIVVNSR